MQLDSFHRQLELFFENLTRGIEREGVVIQPHWCVDHLCYRSATLEEYEVLKKAFSEFSVLLIESPVNGRMISTFKLFEPVRFLQGKVDVVELPAPKPGKTFVAGFEHIEVVMDLPFSDLIQQYPNIEFDSSSLTKEFNQELKLKLPGGAIKFHHLSLESVVRLENNRPVFEKIQQLGILRDFAMFDPLIAGTFPLGIHTTTSDVDVLMGSSDLKVMEDLLRKKYSSLPDFTIEHLLVQAQSTLLASFVYENLPFEIFVQDTPPIRQRGYLHFLIEERLLKLGGPSLKAKIEKLRADGVKTEPAFAQALNLSGDPYLALLELQKKDEKTLTSLLKENHF